EHVAVLVAVVADQVAAGRRRGARSVGDLHEVDGALGCRSDALPDPPLGHGEARAMRRMHDRHAVRVLRRVPGVRWVPAAVAAPADPGPAAAPPPPRSTNARLSAL